MPLAEVVSTIAQGRMTGGFLTVPEGRRVAEVADSLDQSGVSSRDQFVDLVLHPPADLTTIVGGVPNGHSLEGYLYPDSYRFRRGESARDVARTMLQDFHDRVPSDLASAFAANGLSLYQGVTLASIVEREAVVPSDRPIVASVYVNRLKRGMRLQADPTVQYALFGDDRQSAPGSYWKRSLTFADLAIESPYNTYQMTGLPPGPICSPGLASLVAVAHPSVSDYLYFVAKPDGSHAFSATFEEQQQNVARYRP
jgi:UPF0755 protein